MPSWFEVIGRYADEARGIGVQITFATPSLHASLRYQHCHHFCIGVAQIRRTPYSFAHFHLGGALGAANGTEFNSPTLPAGFALAKAM